MKINSKKTQLLCISTPGSPAVELFVRIDNQKVLSKEFLKICGYHFGSMPTVTAQVSVMERKFNERCWALRNLQRSGFNKRDLLTVYKSLIRPVFDFTAVAYHSLLTNEQTEHLERLQRRALCIIDPDYSTYASSLTDLDLTTLQQRRLGLIDNFLDKTLQNPRNASKWFPRKTPHNYDTRHEHQFIEYKCNNK